MPTLTVKVTVGQHINDIKVFINAFRIENYNQKKQKKPKECTL